MSRPRTIVGIGDAFLVEWPDHLAPGGLALRVAMAAHGQGHRGMPISRLGQDRFADELLGILRDAGVETSHLQSDPDLPTARVRRRPGDCLRDASVGGFLAFDNIQWDYDLTDLAQQTDIVIFGPTGARGGQARSVIDRFLEECTDALAVTDLADCPRDDLDRSVALGLLDHADVAALDDAALSSVRPAADLEAPREEIIAMLRRHSLQRVLLVRRAGASVTLESHDADSSAAINLAAPGADLAPALVAFAVAVLRGDDHVAALASAQRAMATNDADASSGQK